MARIARIVVGGVAHHVTQRGENGQDVFFVEDNGTMRLKLLKRLGGAKLKGAAKRT
jgi:hypothetical protein